MPIVWMEEIYQLLDGLAYYDPMIYSVYVVHNYQNQVVHIFCPSTVNGILWDKPCVHHVCCYTVIHSSMHTFIVHNINSYQLMQEFVHLLISIVS